MEYWEMTDDELDEVEDTAREDDNWMALEAILRERSTYKGADNEEG